MDLRLPIAPLGRLGKKAPTVETSFPVGACASVGALVADDQVYVSKQWLDDKAAEVSRERWVYMPLVGLIGAAVGLVVGAWGRPDGVWAGPRAMSKDAVDNFAPKHAPGAWTPTSPSRLGEIARVERGEAR
jgi:hypothetical protein